MALSAKRKISVQPFIEIVEKNKNIKNVTTTFKGNIVDEQSNVLKTVEFGKAFVHLFNEYLALEPLTDYIDSIINDYSGDIKCYYRNLKEMLDTVDLKKEGITGTVAVIHYIFIDQQFRNQGLGKVYLGLLIDSLKNKLRTDFVVLESSPVELSVYDTNYNFEVKRLDQMYSNFGFIKMKGKGLDKNYMILDLKKASNVV